MRARAQPNIALVKYWGKRDTKLNLPAVGSISITLADLYTDMDVEFDASLDVDVLTVNGDRDERMLPRLSASLDAMLGADRMRARIDSDANFPIAAGLASSASAFAALVVAANAAAGLGHDRQSLARHAGHASGSAARSLYGGFVELSNNDDHIDVKCLLQAEAWPLDVVVAITRAGPKPVGSGDAMEISRRTSPFYQRWVDAQDDDLAVAREAIATRDFGALAGVAEHNCLKMHSVMWASRPPMMYWNQATLNCLETVRDLQRQGTDVFFTIDAGPQVKAVCAPGHADVVRNALAATDGVVDLRVTGLGNGARLVGDE